MDPRAHLRQDPPQAETLLERAVRRHLAMLDRTETPAPAYQADASERRVNAVGHRPSAARP